MSPDPRGKQEMGLFWTCWGCLEVGPWQGPQAAQEPWGGAGQERAVCREQVLGGWVR